MHENEIRLARLSKADKWSLPHQPLRSTPADNQPIFYDVLDVAVYSELGLRFGAHVPA